MERVMMSLPWSVGVFSKLLFGLSPHLLCPSSAMQTVNSPPCIAYLARGHVVHMMSAVGGGGGQGVPQKQMY